MISYKYNANFCPHDFKVIDGSAHSVTGPNLMGKEVTAIIADSKCILCDEGNIKLIKTQ